MGACTLYPPEAREDILTDLRRAYRLSTRRGPGEGLSDFFKRTPVLLHRSWLEWVVFSPEPALVTPEGDPIVLTRTIFDVRDRPALGRALASHPDLDDQGDASYVWLEAASAQAALERGASSRGAPSEAIAVQTFSLEGASRVRRTLGTFVLKGPRLVLETMSRERAERGRRFLEGLVGDAVRYRATRYEDLDRVRAASRHPPEPRPPDVPPEVEAELLGRFYEQHSRAWLDQPVPALGNRTPRQAARLKAMRPRLIALLKEFENGSERLRREGRPAYDFGWMWDELGLGRP